MTIKSFFHGNNRRHDQKTCFLKKHFGLAAHPSELFWGSVSFLLFLVMGPFSVFAVVIGLWNIARSGCFTGLSGTTGW